MHPAKSYVPAKDVADQFGFPSIRALNHAVLLGEFPRPDRHDVRDLWEVKTLYQEWKRRNA